MNIMCPLTAAPVPRERQSPGIGVSFTRGPFRLIQSAPRLSARGIFNIGLPRSDLKRFDSIS